MNPTVGDDTLSKLCEELRCPGCYGRLTADEGSAATPDEPGALHCAACGETFPVAGGIPRMVLRPLREAVAGTGAARGADARQAATARSFGYEWNQFSVMRDEW